MKLNRGEQCLIELPYLIKFKQNPTAFTLTISPQSLSPLGEDLNLSTNQPVHTYIALQRYFI